MNCAAILFLMGAAMTVHATVAGAQSSTPAAEELFYLSGAPKSGRNSIDLYRLDTATGKIGPVGESTELPNPNFLAMSRDQRFLYVSCNPKEGAAAAFAIDPGTGKLTGLNQVGSAGQRAVHVTLDPSGRVALVANYQGNTVAVLGIGADGALKEATAEGVQTHTGSGPNAARQAHPFPHSIYPDPTGKFAYSCDLGADKIYCYRLDAARAALTPNDPAVVSTPPGSGPRHLAFSPNGKRVYVVTEMGNTLIGYDFDAATGRLKEFQSVSTLPKGGAGMANVDQQRGGEVQVHPNGKFLFASNRGPYNSIATFSIEAGSGKLTAVGDVGAGGNEPRFFIVDPSGQFLLVGNQFSDNVVVFRVDAATGQLNPSGEVSFPTPLCMVFWKKPQ